MNDQTHPTDIYIGAMIRKVRHEKRVTQQALAQRVGVKFQQLQKYETGQNRVSGSRLWMIARELDVDVAKFFPPVTPNTSLPPVASVDEVSLRIARKIADLPDHARAAMARVLDALRKGLRIEDQDDIEPQAEAETEVRHG